MLGVLQARLQSSQIVLVHACESPAVVAERAAVLLGVPEIPVQVIGLWDLNASVGF